jgi:hypothetical protein
MSFDIDEYFKETHKERERKERMWEYIACIIIGIVMAGGFGHGL